jgi:hypothetical protein
VDDDYEARLREARGRLLRGIGRNVARLGLAVGALVALSMLLTAVSEVLFAPWALGWGGSPTLTGEWAGPLRSKWGSEYYLYLDLDWKAPRGRTSRAGLIGAARICTRAGKEHQMTISGDADPSAQDVRIDVEARQSRYRESLPLRGAWDGETLRLSAFTTPFGPDGELIGGRAMVSSSTTDREGRFVSLYPTNLTPNQVPADDFPEVTLRKGGAAAYQSGCQALRASR